MMPLLTAVSCVAPQAQEQLFHARRVLGYSYVYAFYMFGNAMFREEITPDQNAINQNLFEDQQQQLEVEVGSLIPVHSAKPVNSPSTAPLCRHGPGFDP